MRSFLYRFQVRSIICLITIFAMMLVCIVRIINICSDEKLALSSNNTLTVDLQSKRGEIYDCNGKKITSSSYKYAVVFLPTENALVKYASLTSGEQRQIGLSKLRQKKPTVLIKDKPINEKGIYSYKISERYSDIISLEHIIGYVDDKNHGSMGLEKAYDDLLFSNDELSVSFTQDASGEFLLGVEPILNNNVVDSALYLTIDSDIQKIAVSAAKSIQKGAVVITEVSSGKIRAMVSKPNFDINNLSEFINRDDSPFLNRALSAYSVGSVFKPLIAAAMLETKKGDFMHICNGYSEFLGLRFYCNKHSGHGKMNMSDALAFSCNTYFYNGAQQISCNALSSLASAFGFGNRVKIAESVFSQKGNITSLEQLQKSSAAVANFAIGQGDIALSPLVLTNLYSAIANDGVFYEPTIIEAVKNNGEYKRGKTGEKNIVLSKATAAVLKEDLINAVDKGTGASAKPEFYGAGGKTATAQTGRFENKKEILNAWFCGFFPAKKPKYVIVIMSENAMSGGDDCGPIFKKIADEIAKL